MSEVGSSRAGGNCNMMKALDASESISAAGRKRSLAMVDGGHPAIQLGQAQLATV